MGALDDLLDRWRNMDSVDRQNFYFAVVGVIVLILLMYTLSDTLDMFGSFIGKGASYANSSVNSARTYSPIP